MIQFTSLFRFRGEDGGIHYGEAGASLNHTRDSLTGRLVRIFQGGIPWDEGFKLSESRRKVVEVTSLFLHVKQPRSKLTLWNSKVLCPLPHTPIFICIGLNYKQHASEAGEQLCFIFRLRVDPLTLVLPEAELCLVIGKDCKDFKADNDISEYILGYTVGNDLSSRYWQNPERCGGQHGSAKSFDKFAPIGPVITSTKTIPNLATLQLECFVNGDKRQSSKLDDLIFDAPAILAHLTRGTTLRKGTVIMTGTPSGVAAFMKPPAWLQDGDVVEVRLDHVGSIKNKISLETAA
ncbi:unnamed protein product [Clonostachys solani]|uniref:Fumarylacetoacetase-like C-terminal domain-containing protein n=1 Tax=Clonostachys solani TaxID=160281 RepID=A0A9P0EPJ1_9HYPO|nr:unnamed protein product [Clonostachys solani]